MNFYYEFRNNNNKQAIVFIHGFTGQPDETWRDFAEFLKLIPALNEFDILSIGYPSSKKLDIPFWSSDPAISTIAKYVVQAIDMNLKTYESIHFIAHSMGGLVLQRLIVDDYANQNIINRIKSLNLFGTPSNGLKKAIMGYFIKRQAREMYTGSSFIKDLRSCWSGCFDKNLPFKFCVVAGMEDNFVPKNSSLECYSPSYHRYTNGNHLSMI